MAGTDFGIAIKVDPGNSKSGIDGLTEALSKLETAGAKVNERMRDSKGRFSDTAAGAKQAGEALSGLSEEEAEFERMVLLGNAAKAAEEAMLKKLIGPMQQLEREIELINSLHEQGAIKTDVFTAAIAKRNQALARMEGGGKGFDSTAGQQFGPVFDSSKAGAGGAGAGTGEGGGGGALASTLGVGIGVGSIVAGAKALFEANEAYERLENTVRKFQATGESATQTVDRMRDIQDVMRASLADTIGLYDRVTVATRDLYLTQQQQVQITESIGLISKESNVDIGTTEAVLKKLAYAAESGTLSTRDLRATFTQLPAVLDILKNKYGENEKGILAMAAQGKIGPRDIFLAVQEFLPQAQAKIGDYTRTASERMAEMTNAFVNAGRDHEKWADTVSRGGAEVVAAEDKVAEAAKRGELQTKRWADAMETFAKVAKDVKEALEHLADGNYQLKLRLDDYTNSIGAAQLKLKVLQDQKQAFLATPSLGAADPAFSRKLDDDIAKQKLIVDAMKNSVPQAAVDVGTKRVDYASEVEALTIAEHNEALTAQQRIDAHTALIEIEKKHAKQTAGLRDEMEKLEDRLVKQAQQFEHSMTAADSAFAHNKISLSEYNDEVERLVRGYKDVDIAKVLALNQLNIGRQNELGKQHANDYNALDRLYSTGTFDGSTGNAAEDLRRKQQQDADDARFDAFNKTNKPEDQGINLAATDALIAQGSTEVQKYTAAVGAMHLALIGSNVPAEAQAEIFKKLHDSLNDMKTPQEVFAQGVKDANEKLNAGIYTLDGYAKKMHELREAAGTGTAGDGLYDAFQSFKKQSTDNAYAASLFANGISEINKGFDSLVSGKGSFEDWAASVVESFAKIIEQMLLTRAAMAALSGLGFGVPALGGSVADAVSSPGPVTVPTPYIAAFPSPSGGSGSPSSDARAQSGTVINFHYHDHSDSRQLPMPVASAKDHATLMRLVNQSKRR